MDRTTNRTSNGCGWITRPGTMVLGSKSGNVFPSGSIMVVVCSKVDKNRKVRDLANTSPMQLLFPRPNTNNLKLKKCSLHPQNVVQIYIIWINLDLLLLSSYFCIVFTFCYTVSLADFFFHWLILLIKRMFNLLLFIHM